MRHPFSLTPSPNLYMAPGCAHTTQTLTCPACVTHACSHSPQSLTHTGAHTDTITAVQRWPPTASHSSTLGSTRVLLSLLHTLLAVGLSHTHGASWVPTASMVNVDLDASDSTGTPSSTWGRGLALPGLLHPPVAGPCRHSSGWDWSQQRA